MSFLEVRKLTKKFGSTEVLKGIDVTLEKGEVLSVIGSSGNGKTTFMRCLNNLEKADGGEIFVNGEKIFPVEKEKKEENRTFGMVFQNFNLFPQYTALENVLLPMSLQTRRGKKMSLQSAKSQNKDKAIKLLQQVGLGDKLNNYPSELSGGQQQRVAIARALGMDPQILCFDEPTSALDPSLTGEIANLIKSLKTEGRTMIVVTHEMDFAKKIADKVIFISGGKVIEEGTPQEIFENAKTEEVKAFIQGGNDDAK